MTGENLVKIDDITPAQLAGICDHTFLNRPEAYKKEAKRDEDPVHLYNAAFSNFLDETFNLPFKPYAICVRPEEVENAKWYLDKFIPNVKVASVVGFPDGAYHTDVKLSETELAIKHGATEIDMVINPVYVKEERLSYMAGDEIKSVVKVAHERSAIVKVILETSRLAPEEIVLACKLSEEAGADFVKTSTGFSASGAKANDLKIMRQYFPRGVKMSGGVNMNNVKDLLYAASGRTDGYINLDPAFIRIGESSLLSSASTAKTDGKY